MLALLLPLLAQGKDDADAKKAFREKIKELKKQLEAGGDQDKQTAISELAGLHGEEARTLLASQLSGTTAIRQAAIRALSKHRSVEAVRALTKLVEAEVANEPDMKILIQSLSDLDMCACLPILLALLEADKYDLASDALGAIEKIGCPEAVPGLLDVLKRAEAQAGTNNRQGGYGGGGRKRLGGVAPPAPTGGTMTGPIRGPYGGGAGKPLGTGSQLGKLLQQIQKTLSSLTGQSFAKYQDWVSWFKSGGSNFHVSSVFMCELTWDTFEDPPGKTKKCPNGDGKQSHADAFLKHKRADAPADPKR